MWLSLWYGNKIRQCYYDSHYYYYLSSLGRACRQPWSPPPTWSTAFASLFQFSLCMKKLVWNRTLFDLELSSGICLPLLQHFLSDTLSLCTNFLFVIFISLGPPLAWLYQQLWSTVDMNVAPFTLFCLQCAHKWHTDVGNLWLVWLTAHLCCEVLYCLPLTKTPTRSCMTCGVSNETFPLHVMIYWNG